MHTVTNGYTSQALKLIETTLSWCNITLTFVHNEYNNYFECMLYFQSLFIMQYVSNNKAFNMHVW